MMAIARDSREQQSDRRNRVSLRQGLSNFDDGTSLVPHDRLNELTDILATGIHHLRAIHSALPEWAQSPADSSPVGLEQGRQLALMGPGLQPESEEIDDVH